MDPAFAAGFFDGDGCVYADKRGYIAISITQACSEGQPPELIALQDAYGGNVTVHSQGTASSRKQWRYTIKCVEGLRGFLSAISLHCIVKSPQVSKALQILESGQRKTESYVELRAMKTCYQQVAVQRERIVPAYLAGLFAAEGTVGLYRKPSGRFYLSSRIYQDSCIELLNVIAEVVGFGSVSSGAFKMSDDQTKRFMQIILPHLLGQKVEQATLVLEFQANRPASGKRRPEGFEERAQVIAEKLKKLKQK